MKAHLLHLSTLTIRVAALILLLSVAGSALAVDGCKLLLCMAGNWQHIEQCEPTVRQALRDVARGRGWPTCSMGGNSGSGSQFVLPEQCPEQYLTVAGTDDYGRPIFDCPYQGVVQVMVDGQPWSRTWWSVSGDSVVEWLPAARAAFAGSPSSMDDRFERDHAAWLLSTHQPDPPPDGPVEAGRGGR